jgi:hypothetical protein
VVIGDKDTVIFWMMNPPSQEEIHSLLSESKAYANKIGFKKTDVKKAIRKARWGE